MPFSPLQTHQEILDPYANAICDALPKKIVVPIQGATLEQKKIILDTINEIRASAPVFERYFDFVVSYSRGFNIFVPPKNKLKPDKFGIGYDTHGQFSPLTNTMLLPVEVFEKNTDVVSLHTILRHEMRHAYWFAMQSHSIGSDAFSSACYSPIDDSSRKKIADAIKKGDARVAALETLLYKESHKQTLNKEDTKWLSRLRKSCEKTNPFYYLQTWIDTDLAGAKSVQNRIGKTHKFLDTETNVVGLSKFLSASLNPPSMLVEVLDPLYRFIRNKKDALRITNSPRYETKNVEYEREAFLYGDTPIPLIREFYPELVNLTNNIEQKIMSHPHPMAIPADVPYFRTKNDFLNAKAEKFFSYKAAFEGPGINTGGFLEYIKNLIMDPVYFGIEFNKLRFALQNLLQKGISEKDKAEVNRLMAQISNKENDSLGACRFYHRAFKQGADFTFEDYVTCLENLTKHNKLGDARIICQKARAKYNKHYESIPPSYIQSRESFHNSYLRKLQEWYDHLNKNGPKPK